MIDGILLETIASTLPPHVSPDDEERVTQHACKVCEIFDIRAALIEPHIPEIIQRAKALQHARAH